MTKVMTPSKFITDGQIGKLQELLGARLRKSRLPNDPVQQVLETQGDAIADEMLAVIRERVEAVSGLIVRRVEVDRIRTPQQALDATGRKQHTNRKVVDAMPCGEGAETDVYFFKPRPEAYKNGLISDDRLEVEYEFHGLKPADPYTLAAVNEADSVFADEHPNGTHWKNVERKWCYTAFDRWYDERYVGVDRSGDGWDDSWRFAGVPK